MTDLAELLRDRLADVPVPAGDLAGVEHRGRRIRRRRRAVAAGVTVVACAAAVALWPGSDDRPGGQRGIDPIGRLDFSHGLRAYADPGQKIYLGGREFPAPRLDFLDTDGAATPDGVLYYDEGRPALLDEAGEVRWLEPGATSNDHHPTAKVDAQQPWVAYGDTRDGRAEVVVRDLSTDDVVARRDVPAATVIDGLEDGVVFLRTADGTTTWDTATDQVEELAGPKTRVADVRKGVLLYDGPAPDGPAAAAYRLVKGTVDAQLTLDGQHVLDWSPVLASTSGGASIRLDVPKGVQFFTIDTDGSVLAAVRGSRPKATVFDCEIPSGTCERLGTIAGRGGDPEFIGNDM